MPRSVLWIFILTWLAFPTWAETVSCEATNLRVNSPQLKYVDLTCEAVKQAEALFDQCNLPAIAEQVRINIVDELATGCVALYHCDDSLIEVLEPSLMEVRREPEDAFAFLGIGAYYQSVIVHELAHSLFDDVPCPFAACVTASEYVAYTLQVMSLSPDAQTMFAANSGLDREIFQDELSAMMYYMAPHLFAQKAWAHLSQYDDPCTFIGQIMDGTVLLDYEDL